MMFATMLPIIRTLDLIGGQPTIFGDLYRRTNSPYGNANQTDRALRNSGLSHSIPMVVHEGDSLLRIESKLAGVGRDRIRVSITGSRLSVRLFCTEGNETEFDSKSTGNFVESQLTLPPYIDLDSARAAYTDGLLQVEFDHVPAATPRYVELSDSLEKIKSPGY